METTYGMSQKKKKNWREWSARRGALRIRQSVGNEHEQDSARLVKVRQINSLWCLFTHTCGAKSKKFLWPCTRISLFRIESPSLGLFSYCTIVECSVYLNVELCELVSLRSEYCTRCQWKRQYIQSFWWQSYTTPSALAPVQSNWGYMVLYDKHH